MQISIVLIGAAALLLRLPSAYAEDGHRLAAASRITTPLLASIRMGDRLPALKGWDYLVHQLALYGVDEQALVSVYSDRRMPEFTPIYFQLVPKESSHMYRGFTAPARLSTARQFLAAHRTAFAKAEAKFGVDRSVIAAIMLIESNCGQITGNSVVLHRLSRLAAVTDPGNIKTVYQRHKQRNPKVKLAEVQARANVLEEMFLPQVAALFTLSLQDNFEIFELRGSQAGAFGIPQFLPLSFLKYAVDGNKNGTISLFEVEDAILSTANYLASHGWNNTGSESEKAAVIWHYNRSEPYVRTVLEVAGYLR